VPPLLQYSDHQVGRGPEFYARPCELSLEGIVSEQADAPYAPGNRGLWLKVKCLNREEFVVVGWTDPDALEVASTMRSLSDCATSCNLLPRQTCRWMCCRHVTAASAHRSSSAGCIGCEPSS